MTAASKKQRRTAKQIVFRATMREIEPPIWRLISVPDGFTLHRLHKVLQVVFSRLDYHLYSFDVGGRTFQYPDPESEVESEDSTSVLLSDLKLLKGSTFEYLYDFGDSWEHDLVVDRFLAMPPPNFGEPFACLLKGERAAPPEDAGGTHGYELLLEALRDPDHPEHQEYRQWAGLEYDPERFDPWAVNQTLILAAAWGAI